MNKYYTQINIKLSTSQVQTGDNANYIRLMSKMMVERIFLDAIKNNKELRSLFSNSKPKVKIYIERVDKTKDKRERKRPDKKINKQILKYPHRIESLGDQLEIAIISMDEMMERKKLYDFLNEKIEKADEVEINSQNTNMLKAYREKKSKIKKLFNK